MMSSIQAPPSDLPGKILSEKEKAKAEKAKRFAEKQVKHSTPALAEASSSKAKKTRAEHRGAEEVVDANDYIEDTPAGHKKSMTKPR